MRGISSSQTHLPEPGLDSGLQSLLQFCGWHSGPIPSGVQLSLCQQPRVRSPLAQVHSSQEGIDSDLCPEASEAAGSF